MKNKIKKIFALVITFLVLTTFLPISVFAENLEPTVVIDFTDGVVDGNKITYTLGQKVVNVELKSTYQITKDMKVNIKEQDLMSAFIFDESYNQNEMNIKFYADDGFGANYILTSEGTIVRDGEGGLPQEVKLKIELKNQENNNQGENSFSGNVFFVWNSNGKVCASKISEIIPGGRDGYVMNYIKESDIVDTVNATNTKLNINDVNGKYYFLWEKSESLFQNKELMDSWEKFSSFMSKEENLRNYSIDPCGAVNGNSTITTNGDRNFRLTIYSENQYEAVAFGTNENDYTYFPDFLNQDFFSSTIDISKTTQENPAKYEVSLQEKKVKFSTGEKSKYDIKSVIPLVSNSKAVTVNKVNDEFEITFNSNFYDRVTLELTDVSNNKYYLKICRTAIVAYDNFGPDNTLNKKITTDVYYSKEKNYKDFEVYANILNKDGTSKIVKSTSCEIIDIFDGTKLGYESEGGKNLKKASFEVDVDDNVEKIYFNVVYKNASDSNEFAGVFAGSNKGALYSIEERGIIYE